MNALDEWLFSPTTLSLEQQATIEQHFRQQLLPLLDKDSNAQYTLHFRNWSGQRRFFDEAKDGKDSDTQKNQTKTEQNLGKGIANAFALPSGDIVVTDRLVQLASVEELDAVLLHEMGHVFIAMVCNKRLMAQGSRLC